MSYVQDLIDTAFDGIPVEVSILPQEEIECPVGQDCATCPHQLQCKAGIAEEIPF